MYNINKSEEAGEVVKEGRLIVWYRLRDQGVEIDQHDINGLGDVKVDTQRKKIDDEAASAFATQASTGAPAAKGKAPPPKGKADPKAAAGAPPTEEKDETEDKKKLDFSVPVEYQLATANVEFNSSNATQNIYLQ